jgi:signal transduction histidine kinase
MESHLVDQGQLNSPNGFDKIREGALGLVGMRERVTLLGGRFEIDSAPNNGTTLLVELPS